MTGIGGDCFWLVSQPGKPLWGYNGSGRSGVQGLVPRRCARKACAKSAPRSTPSPCRARSMPGRQILKAHGRFGLDRALGAGDQICRRRLSRRRARRLGLATLHRQAQQPIPAPPNIICSTARRRKEGDVIRFPALAATLKTIAAKGARAFYEGEIADDMAATLAARGSFLTAEDFAAHQRRCGHADLEQLSRARSRRIAAERAGPHRAGDAQHSGEFRSRRRSIRSAPSVFICAGSRAHRLCRARHARRRRRAYARSTVADLLDKGFAKKLAAKIDLAKRAGLPSAPTPGSDTVYLTSSTATAWRCRSSTRSIRISAPASAPKRPASC